MIVHFNQSLQTTRTGREGSRETFAELAGRVVESLATLLQQGQVDVRTLSTLRIHLDWIQYRANFRDPVTVRRAVDAQGRMLALAEIAIDLRQVEAERLTPLLAEAQKALGSRPVGAAPVPHPSAAAALGAPVPEDDNAPVALDDFRPFRDSPIWEFNRLFWQRLADWEAASILVNCRPMPTRRSVHATRASASTSRLPPGSRKRVFMTESTSCRLVVRTATPPWLMLSVSEVAMVLPNR